ncbi:hypothetical protein J45TS6_35590 [Paenibacillus sp. J45TS6]|uniref:Uncharacterized protein n=1 Tax=Paenibacillus gallinarum TaxID=2762232 RepID=A0ABR8T6N5_9BACL|nr:MULTISPECIES: hypothetical protein [Paenibacillus]MBD7971254.1 hypothetical protein [Paenibacillus gallinarum]GIP45100.1 hypothetical protein J45TS6_35590 [Paenibacillus sp. J45TS6]
MKKKIALLLAASSMMGALFIGDSIIRNDVALADPIVSPQAVSPSDTDLISMWMVDDSGARIYTPVSVTTNVQINATTSGSNWVATRRELVSSTHKNAFLAYPNATWGAGTLELRGGNVSLPKKGAYIGHTELRYSGKYNDARQTYSSTSAPAAGSTVFYGGFGSFQLDNTAWVNFNW